MIEHETWGHDGPRAFQAASGEVADYRVLALLRHWALRHNLHDPLGAGWLNMSLYAHQLFPPVGPGSEAKRILLKGGVTLSIDSALERPTFSSIGPMKFLGLIEEIQLKMDKPAIIAL